MDSPGITLQDLLGPVMYADWFGNESSTTSTEFGDETVRGGAGSELAEKTRGGADSERADTSETMRGGADTAASSSSGDEVDKLLMLASQQFEKQDSGKQEKLDARFATSKTDEEVIKMRQNAVPQKTRQDTGYCVRVWDAWASNRNQSSNAEDTIQPLLQLSLEKLQYWFSRFVLEARKKDGTEYPPNSLYHIVCGLMRYLRQNGRPSIDFFKDSDFSTFRQTLDAEMKRLKSTGLGSKPKQAEPLTEVDEEKLWQAKVLGDHSPQALLNTIIFMNGVYFALRSGAEHRQLRHKPCQIQLIENSGERPYLEYSEDVSKNHPGGLKSRKIRPKIVQHHGNPDSPDRCFVCLFKLYSSLCPANRPDHAFYLSPLANPKDSCWYSHTPLGHNKLRNAVAEMCKQAGISGYHTNHSLRATAATRLYCAGVDEQMVMERTGHRSLEGIRSYKRTSKEQRMALSDILNCKKPCLDRNMTANDHSLQAPSLASVCTSQSVSRSVNDTFQYSSKTAHAFNFNLSSCGTVNINFNSHQ